MDYVQAHPLGLIALLLGAWALVRIVNDPNNTLDWWQFVSSKGDDGKNYADLDKVGKLVGIGVSSWAVIVDSYAGKADAGLMGVYLAFVGGVAGYSAYLRSKQQ